jgi:iron(III) transport system substrate-binding protein
MRLANIISALAVALMVTLGGCDRDKSAPTTTMPLQQITVYTALEPDEIGALVPLFNAEHPEIQLKIVRESTGVITSKLLAEGSNTPADAVWGVAATSLLNADGKGLLAGYSPSGIDQISPEFKDPNSPPHWEGIDGYMTAFAVNTVELDKAGAPIPRGYADLIKPAYHGMITMPDPSQSGTGFLTVAGLLQSMGEDAGWKYLDELDKNIAAYTQSGSKPAEFAARGEHPIGISFDYRVLEEKSKGSPLEIVFPVEKSGWEIEANALIQKPSMNPAAKTFLDWAISPPAFKYYSSKFGIMANPTYAHPLAGFPANPKDQMVKNNFAWAAQNRDRILTEWANRYGGKKVAWASRPGQPFLSHSLMP